MHIRLPRLERRVQGKADDTELDAGGGGGGVDVENDTDSTGDEACKDALQGQGSETVRSDVSFFQSYSRWH